MKYLKLNLRKFSSAVAQQNTYNKFKMQSWLVHDYGADLMLSSTRIPIINGINDVLVKVKAVSVNPLDLYMKDGYGRTVINLLRKDDELPLTLGRDFCGTIVHKGIATSEEFQIGDLVYGFIPPNKQGSFSEYVLAEESHICHQPDHLQPHESASIAYAAMSAWSALFITGNLQFQNNINKRVLILGASGGVGTIATQLLKSQGIHVTGTCSTDAIPLVMSLGADEVLDYTQCSYMSDIADNRFDIILDCAKFGYENVPRNWKFNQYITMNSPLMLDTDKHGIMAGFLKSGSTLISNNIDSMKNGKVVKWGYFIPCGSGFQFIDELVKKKAITPLIHKKFDFDHLPDAFDEVKKGHLRGKVVVTME